jgi:hypothetical protein
MSGEGVLASGLMWFGPWYALGILIHGLLCYFAFKKALAQVPKDTPFEAKCGEMGVKCLGPVKVRPEPTASEQSSPPATPTSTSMTAKPSGESTAAADRRTREQRRQARTASVTPSLFNKYGE